MNIIRCSCPEGVLRKSCTEKLHKTHKKTACVRVSFSINLQTVGLQIYWKESTTQVFSCEFCKNFQSRFL